MKKRGRPFLNEEDKIKYQRIAIYKSTHERLKIKCKDSNMNIVDYIDGLV